MPNKKCNLFRVLDLLRHKYQRAVRETLDQVAKGHIEMYLFLFHVHLRLVLW